MQVLEAAVGELANPWPLRRERAAELVTKYPHAADILRLYQALIPVWETAFKTFPSPLAGERQGGGISPDDVAEFAVNRVLPAIIDATVESGPARLRDGVVSVFCTADLTGLVRNWLDGKPLSPFETYLARVSTGPVLEAAAPGFPSPSGGGQGRGSETSCPRCLGLPQLSYFAISGEVLVTGPRYLVCSRCNHNWVFPRMTCASCGEANPAKLPIYQEHDAYPHVRVDGCRSCRHYLVSFDLRRDTRAVPIVDELACLPLDLFARDQGLSKITPNLVGN
jgi:hypothetical protein